MNKCNHQGKYPRLFNRLEGRITDFLSASTNRDAKVVEEFWHNDIKHIWDELSDFEAIKVLKILIKSRSEAAKYAWETTKIQTIWNSLSTKEILSFYDKILKKSNIKFSSNIWEDNKVKFAWDHASLKDSLNLLKSAFHHQATSVSRSMFYNKILENFENITLEDLLSLLESIRKDKNGDIISKIGEKIKKEFEQKNVEEMEYYLKRIKNSKHKPFIKDVICSIENSFHIKIHHNKTLTSEKILSNYSVLSNNFNKFGCFNFFKLNKEKSNLIDELCMADLNLPLIEKISENLKKNNTSKEIYNFTNLDLLKSSKNTISHFMDTNYSNLTEALSEPKLNIMQALRKNSLSETESIKNFENQSFLKSPFFNLLSSFDDFLLTDEVLNNFLSIDKESSKLAASREDSYISNLTELFNTNFTLFEICTEMKSQRPGNLHNAKLISEQDLFKKGVRNYTEDEKSKLLSIYNAYAHVKDSKTKYRINSIFSEYNKNNPNPRSSRAIEYQVQMLDKKFKSQSKDSDSFLGKNENSIQIPKEDRISKKRKKNIEYPSNSEQYFSKSGLESPKI